MKQLKVPTPLSAFSAKKKIKVFGERIINYEMKFTFNSWQHFAGSVITLLCLFRTTDAAARRTKILMFEKKIKRKKNRKKNKLKIPDDATNQAKSNIFGSDWKNEKMFWDPPSAKAPLRA